VDTVISFEQAGTEVRMLQAVKNRFGSVDEVGLFRMTEEGLAEVTDPSALFLVHREDGLPPGVAVAPVFEGSRVLLVEIQALVVPAKGGISRIYSDRIDSGRAARVAAVLEKHLGARFSELDLYVNVAGGIRIAEVGVELPLALALYSAKVGVPLPERLAVTGEVSLAGEVRPVSGIEKRLRACQEMGFSPLIGPLARPDAPRRQAPPEGLVAVPHVRDAVKAAFGRNAPKEGAG
jgi:DNA repair protein RadA/Sms